MPPGCKGGPLGCSTPGPLRSWQCLCEAAPGLPCTVTKRGEAAVINAVPLGSRRAANHMLWQRPGGSGSRSQGRALSKHQPPAPRNSVAWGAGWYPALICPAHATASSPPSGTLTILSNQSRRSFLKDIYALQTILLRPTVVPPWRLTWLCLYYQPHIGAENCLARGMPRV